MTTLTEPAVNVQADATDLERLQAAAAWLAANAPDAEVRAIYVDWGCRGRPAIFLNELADLKRLFPGHTARVVRDGSRREYIVLHEGLQFRATEWVQVSRESQESEVTL